ncbi:MAG: hypothetical protein N3E49_03185 [Bacteroidia bacterium]|nr:hypothetical protein [Bacteroidia bacterium]
MEGFCQCPLPYEGTYCEKDGRERFVGTWEGRKRCDGTTGGLRYRIWANDSLLLYMFIAGRFHGTNEETLGVRFLDAYKLFIPSQTLRDTPILVSGYAEQRQDSLYLTLERQGGANRIDTCYWDLKRR